MMGLSDGRKSFRIGLAVLMQYWSVTDTQPATQPPSHVAVAITLNAQASSLITVVYAIKVKKLSIKTAHAHVRKFSHTVRFLPYRMRKFGLRET